MIDFVRSYGFRVYPSSAVAQLENHAISDESEAHGHEVVQPTQDNIRFENRSKSKHREIRRVFDATVRKRDQNMTNTVKTEIIKRNKIVKKYITRRHSIKHSTQEACTLRSTTINKCIVKDKIIRLRTIKTDIVSHDIVRTSTLVQKVVKTKTLQKDDFVLCTEKMPLDEARKIAQLPIKLKEYSICGIRDR